MYKLFKRCIYRSDDKNNPIEVWQKRDLRWLQFNKDGHQSAMQMQHPEQLVLNYQEVLLSCLQLHTKPQTILLLGIGAGNLIQFLQHAAPEIHITAIDNNPAVVEVAKRYFKLPAENQNFKIIIQDAAEFVAGSQQQFDIILFDIYGENAIPEVFLTLDFYVNCQKCLQNNGLFSANFWCREEAQLDKLIKNIRKTFVNNTLLMPVANSANFIVHASNSENFKTHCNNLYQQGILPTLGLDLEWGCFAELRRRRDI